MKTKFVIILALSVIFAAIVAGHPVSVGASENSLPEHFLPPVRIEGTGTYFEIKDSEYLNISLKSSEEIRALLESIPRMINLDIEGVNEDIDFAELVISGLEPNKTYYKYQDGFMGEVVFISDEEGSYVWNQDLSKNHHVWIQEIKSTLIITEDTVLDSDITGSVLINADNITLDCNNHTITGNYPYYYGPGIYLNNRENVTIKNCIITNFTFGIYLYNSNHSQILNNNASFNGADGIRLHRSSNNTIDNNICSSNVGVGILLWAPYSNNNNVFNNNCSDNREGISLFYSHHSNITNNNILNNGNGMRLFNSSDTHIIDNNIESADWAEGIIVWISSNVEIRDNQFTNSGIFFDTPVYSDNVSYYNTHIIENNTINGKPIYYYKDTNGIKVPEDAGQVILANSNNITVENLNTSHSSFAIQLAYANNSHISNNEISNNLRGIYLNQSSYNKISENNISDNARVAYLYNSSNNKIYHNNFIDNLYRAIVTGGSNNLFDNSYPSGGNYWSDYIGADVKKGENQDKTGSDGIGDTPYVFVGGQDNYPFMQSNGWEIPVNQQNPVLIVPGLLGSAQQNGQWVIDPILHTYDNLIDTLKINGYIQDETLFTFPYNWRRSNVDTAIELKNKINQIKDTCHCSKVDIITHSMGGLVARQYIQSSDYEDDIDKLIFLGTPHSGASESYLTWAGGVVTIKNDVGARVSKKIFQNEAKQNGYNSIFDYIRNKPISSIQELLPIYNYLVDASPLSMRYYPTGYPTNPFLENLNNNLSVLTDSGVTVYNIIGDTQDNSTINYIRVVPSANLPLWEHGYPEGFDESTGDRGLIWGSGDGTVPVQSSDVFSESITISSDHRNLPTNAELQILTELLGPGQYTTVDDMHFPNLILIIKLLSPVDMQVIAPDGKRIGKDFTSNQEINEIPYAFYSGFQTDDEYVTIINPEDGQYKIITQGTGNGGEYTVSSALVSDTQDLEQDFQAYIATGQIENLNLNLFSSDSTINITPEDTTPPHITIISPQNQDYLHSDNLNINYSAVDNESGVFSSSAKFDTINVENGEDIDLFYQPLGSHDFTVQAKDNVNNQFSESVQFRVIATIDSTVSDINRAYSLGWIVKKSTRDSLIRQINKATKLITKIQRVEQKLSDKPKALDKIQKIEKKLDAILGKLILIKLSVFKRIKAINQEAYDTISADINWLINN